MQIQYTQHKAKLLKGTSAGLLCSIPACSSERQTPGLNCVIPPQQPVLCYYSRLHGQGLGWVLQRGHLTASKVIFPASYAGLSCVRDLVRLHWAFVSSCWELVLWASVNIRPGCCGEQLRDHLAFECRACDYWTFAKLVCCQPFNFPPNTADEQMLHPSPEECNCLLSTVVQTNNRPQSRVISHTLKCIA